MGGSFGASISTSSSKGKQNSQSATQFPSEFLSQFSRVFGQGANFDELLRGLPRTQSLFGGAPVGIFPTAPGGGGAQYMPAAQYGAGQQQPSGAPPGGGSGGALGLAPGAGAGMSPAPGGAPGGVPLGLAGPGGGGGQQPRVSVGEIMNIIKDPRYGDQQHTTMELMGAMKNLGIDPAQGMTMDQVWQLVGAITPNNASRVNLGANIPGQLEQYMSLLPGAPRFASSGSPTGVDVMGGIERLGFGRMPEQAKVPTIRDDELRVFGPMAMAAQMQAAQAGAQPQAMSAQSQFAPQGFGQLENSIFESQFRPIERELNRQGTLADRQLTAELAERGLSSSGAGVGQLERGRREREQQLGGAATDAASRAAQQRYGLEFQQQEADAGRRQQTALANAQMAQAGLLSDTERRQQAETNNAQMRQQTALANAGFNLQAQQANVDNILRGDLARADTYLRTIGLNNEMANQARTQFLNLVGLQAADLQRMDQFQVQTLGTLLNNWLQEGALVSGAGQFSTASGSQSSKSFGLSQQSSGGISG